MSKVSTVERYKRHFIESSIKEMKNFFNVRTNFHISLVEKYLQKIINSNLGNKLNKSILKNEIILHDKSKFIEPEYTPYLYITWNYKCKQEGTSFIFSDEMQVKMNNASEHHIKNNKHHPEYWSNQNTNLINKINRDKPPDEIINVTRMPLDYIACMCADWMAMSEELENSPIDWADKNVNIRWKFTKEQSDFIYKILNEIWG